MISLQGSSTNDQQRELNPTPFYLEYNALSTRSGILMLVLVEADNNAGNVNKDTCNYW